MKNGIPLKVENYIFEDNEIYFISSNPRIIGQYDYKSKKMNLLFDYSQIINISKAFTRIIKHNNKIYCIPCYADNIYCYNIISKQFYKLEITDALFQKMPKRKIIEVIEAEDRIYCVCRSPHFVLIIDPQTDEYDIVYYQEIVEEHDWFTLEFREGCIEYPFLHNLIISFNVREKKFYTKKICNKDVRNEWDYIFHFLYDDEGYIWICDYKGDVYRVKDNKEETIVLPRGQINGYKNVDCEMRFMISEMIYMEGKVWFILADNYRILRYGVADKKFEWTDDPQHKQSKREEIHYDICRISKNNICVYKYDDNMFYIWDAQRGIYDNFEIIVPGDVAGRLQFEFSANESDCINLECYISCVQNFEKKGMEDRTLENIGKIIYAFI